MTFAPGVLDKTAVVSFDRKRLTLLVVNLCIHRIPLWKFMHVASEPPTHRVPKCPVHAPHLFLVHQANKVHGLQQINMGFRKDTPLLILEYTEHVLDEAVAP